MQKNPRKKHKQRDSDEEVIEQLQKEIRELKSINRSLMKRLKKVDREYHKALEGEEEESPRPKVKKEEFSCKYRDTSSRHLEEASLRKPSSDYSPRHKAEPV